MSESTTGFAPVWPGPRLVVPITVDALLVGRPDVTGSTWAQLQISYERLLSGGRGEPPPLVPAPPSQVPQPGVHLLWTLPHTLRSGAQITSGDDAGEVDFPLVPNRWLVARFEYPPLPPSQDGEPPHVEPPTMTAVVLESDCLEALAGGSQYPVPGTDSATGGSDLQVQQIGRSVDIAAWDGPAAPKKPFLRAVGPGAVSWSVAYDNVREVFSIHDASLAAEASDAAPYGYTYCVLGWYADPDDDVLAELPTDSIAAWMSALAPTQWSAGTTSSEIAAAEAAWSAWSAARGLDGGSVSPDLPPQIATWIERWRTWQTAHGAPGPEPPLPTQSLLYGWVTNVQWKGTLQAYGSGAPGGGTTAPAVAIGNTPTESIAAWIAKLVFDQYGYTDPAALAQIELALEAFQQGILEELDSDPVGAQETLHTTRFTGQPGGFEWLVVRPEAADGDSHSGQKTVPLDPHQTELLSALNSLQTDVDLLSAQLASLRWELFAAYTKWIDFPRGTSTERFDKVCAALCVLQQEIPVVDGCVTSVEHLLTAKEQELRTALGDTFELKRAALPAENAPTDPVLMIGGLRRDSKLAAPEQRVDDDSETLSARFTGQTVVGLEFEDSDPTGEAPDPTTRLGVGDLLAVLQLPIGNPDGYALPKEAPDLWAEVGFLDPLNAPLLAQLYFQARSEKPSDAEWQALVDQIRQLQTAPFAPLAALGLDRETAAEAVGWIGKPPAKEAIDYRGWPHEEQPWSPVYMDWQLRWFPTPGGFDRILDTWRLGEIDYEWTGTAITGEGIDFFGRTVLNAETAQSVTRQLETFVADDPNFANLPQFVREALQQITHELRDADIVAQSASGLTDRLLSRATDMSYTFTTLGDSRRECDCATGTVDSGEVVSAAAIEKLLGPELRTTQLPIWSSPAGAVSFFPVRAGHLQIVDLWVVDAFGQVLPGKDPNLGSNPIPDPFRAQSMVTRSSRLSSDQNETFASYAQLPPRLSQPSRVSLRLLSAGDDRVPSTSADRTSPICGWIVANHLDSSLMVFDGAGVNLGAVVNVQRDATSTNPSGDGIRWDPAAGSEAQLGAPPALPNAHLQAFIDSLLQIGLTDGGVLLELLAAIDSTLWTVDPFASREGNLPILLGHPVAVVRADVAFQLGGAAAASQDADLTGALYVGRDGDKPVFEPRPAPFEAIRLRLRIGDLALRTNGVFGYFANDDYQSFYTAHGTRAVATTGVLRALRRGAPLAPELHALVDRREALPTTSASGYVVDDHLLELPPQSPATPPTDSAACRDVQGAYTTTKLTVLADPFGDIPAISGSLPTVAEVLPRGPVSAALTRMQASFRIGPILTTPERIKMPLPAQIQGRWSWLARRDVVTFSPEQPIVSDNTVNRLQPTPSTLTEGWLLLSAGEGDSDQ